MRSKSLSIALEENKILSDEILKIRNNSAFQKFINTKIDYSKQVIQPLTEDIALQSVQTVHENLAKQQPVLKTSQEEVAIRTEEICNIPFPFVQTETLLYPDGTKIVTTFYPSNDRIPSKRVEFLAKCNITKTTTFDREGKEKTMERIVINEDNSSYEEYIDFKFSRKTIKRFNNKKITVSIENFVKENLSFRLECDDLGNIKKESTFYTYSKTPILAKEIVYNSDGSYTQKEYNALGNLTGIKTVNCRTLKKA